MKNLIYLLILFFPNNNKDKLTIEGLSKRINKNQNIEFTIVNNSNQKEYFFISLEVFDDKWSEMINDIYQPKEKSTIIRMIKAKKKIKNTISINKIFFHENQLKFKKYRLKIHHGKDINTNEIYYSNSFEIIK